MKKAISMVLALTMTVLLAACGDKNTAEVKTEEGSTLVYGSGDYTRINPAMDEHGEINVLLFNGLTAHDGDNQVVPGLAESWDYDETTYTYTFHIRDGIRWHDGEPFTAKDVQFTIEAIMDPDNGSENAPNYEDVEEITVVDDQTISFRLAESNVAFLEYMTMAVLPSHLLEGEDMQESDFFRHPVGTGPYKLERWDVGQSIVLTKNEDYYLGAPNIDTVIFKIVADDNAQAMQLESGELDLVLLDPKNAANFEGRDGFTCYDMTTADYRGILFNFANDYWTENRDLIPAICCALDRQAIIDSVLLGQGTMTIGAQIAEAVRVHQPRMGRKAMRQRVLELMTLVGIERPAERMGLYPHNFSGGMRQRSVLAMALAGDPAILFADEPTTALDVTIQAQILDLLRQIQQQLGTATVFVTHDLGAVARVADRVAVMYAGKIVEIGTAEEIFYDPRHPYTWGLLQSLPALSRGRETLPTIPGMPPDLLHPPKGDAFACRNPYALDIDYEEEPPMFPITETHFAATWLLDPRALQVVPPVGGGLHG